MFNSPIAIFFLSFIPGLGHFAVNRKFRGFVYSFLCFGILGLSFLIAVSDGDEFVFFAGVFASFMLWIVNMLDIVIYLFKHPTGPEAYQYGNYPPPPSAVSPQGHAGMHSADPAHAYRGDRLYERQLANERFMLLLLSFIPGLGHLQMGLKQRGLTLLVGFFGMLTMFFFLAVYTNQDGFLVFLGALPIIWLYGMVDASSLIAKKQRGEQLQDITILEEWDRERQSGRRSRLVATLLSIFPGAGHMYLGLQHRGLQLMAGFLFSIYILDTLRLTMFLFIVPLIWCYSFFDGLQQSSRYEASGGAVADEPIIAWLGSRKRWLGAGLIILGVYFVFDQLIMQFLPHEIRQTYHLYIVRDYLQSGLVAVLLIVGGIVLFRSGITQKNTREEGAKRGRFGR
ncbi:hypothetical protein [Paenibacillus sp. SYP-B4298]|uniref:hypothetical protein n=1 Tax=Paenibacillus sp. SYP-B4298 TaxID=2996034 RepID=UPI0022DE69FF|nr:hypothetical protein [Paenibacillus sp. SYP-B4298]